MKRLPFRLLLIALAFSGANVYAQQVDSLKQSQIRYIKQELEITDKNAQEVLSIMDQYKESAKQLINDKGLTEEGKRIKFAQLIDNKNAKLKKILTEQQLEKMVPASERHNDAPVNTEKN